MNLRFAIYDLRLAFASGRRVRVFFNRKSSIIDHQFTATISPVAKR
jgi:hypothetical protein